MLVLSGGGSFRAVGDGRGKFEKRSAPFGMPPGVPPAAAAAGGGRCHVPGCVRRGGGGYAEFAVYGLPGAG